MLLSSVLLLVDRLSLTPATFQIFMNHILRDEVIAGHVIVYLDDILIFTDNLEEHRPIVKRVLELLQKHKLYLRPENAPLKNDRLITSVPLWAMEN